MRKNVFTIAMIVVALCVSMSCFAQAGKVNNFRIKRGTNVSHWLSQSEQRGEARRLHIQEDDFARLFWDQQRHTYKDRPLVELLMSGKPLEK